MNDLLSQFTRETPVIRQETAKGARCYRRKNAGFGCFEIEKIRMTAGRGRVRATAPRRTGIGPSEIFPFRFAWQTLGFSGSIRQPCGVGFGIIPTDANSGMIVLLRISRVAPILVRHDLVLGTRPVFATAGFVVACRHDKGGVMFTAKFVFSDCKCRDTDAVDGAVRVLHALAAHSPLASQSAGCPSGSGHPEFTIFLDNRNSRGRMRNRSSRG